jgi:hypothetical protein
LSRWRGLPGKGQGGQDVDGIGHPARSTGGLKSSPDSVICLSILVPSGGGLIA